MVTKSDEESMIVGAETQCTSRVRGALRKVAMHDCARVSARRWSDLTGFEQWTVHARPGSLLNVHSEHFLVTSQAPGPKINCVARVRGRTLENRTEILQIYNPGDLHVQLELKEPESYHVAFFEPAWLEQRAIALGCTPTRLRVFGPQLADPAVVGAFHRLHTVAIHGSSTLERQEALADAVLAFLERGTEACPSSVPRRAPRAVRSAKEIIEDRFAEDISLDELARDVRLNKEHFSRTFRAELGLPPHQYLMQVRLSRARAALAKGEPAAAVAAACGFYDQSHLNRCFRRVMGMTPLEYARAVR